jgi:hypothetical protein
MIGPVISMLALSTLVTRQSACQFIESFKLLPVTVSADVIDFNLAPPNNQMELTGLLTRFASQTSNLTDSIKIGMTKLKATYDIYTELYVPAEFPKGGIVEFAIHGYDIVYCPRSRTKVSYVFQGQLRPFLLDDWRLGISVQLRRECAEGGSCHLHLR